MVATVGFAIWASMCTASLTSLPVKRQRDSTGTASPSYWKDMPPKCWRARSTSSRWFTPEGAGSHFHKQDGDQPNTAKKKKKKKHWCNSSRFKWKTMWYSQVHQNKSTNSHKNSECGNSMHVFINESVEIESRKQWEFHKKRRVTTHLQKQPAPCEGLWSGCWWTPASPGEWGSCSMRQSKGQMWPDTWKSEQTQRDSGTLEIIVTEIHANQCYRSTVKMC